MANDEEEPAKITAAPGAGQGSPRLEPPESGSQTPAEPEGAAMQSPAAEPRETAAPESQSAGEQFSMERHLPEAAAPEPPAAEPVQTAPELIVPPPRLAGKQTKPRSLFPALAATAIAGAVLGIGGTFGLHYFGASKFDFGGSKFGGFASGERVAPLDARIAAIEGREDAASAASRAALAAMESRITDAENAANKAAQSANSAQADAQKALAAEPAAQEPGPGSAPAIADLGPLEARIETLEQKLAPLEAAVAAPKAELSADAAAGLGPLEARIGTLEQKLAPLEAALAAPKAGLRAQPDRADAAAGERSRAEAIAVVAASLLRKLESGGQFSGELAALENLRVPQASLAPLRAASESPVWSERQLTARFASLVPGIIASETAKQASADESFLDRVTRNAKGLLRVHRVGDAGAAGVEGFVARIENALADHDLEAALKAWNELPAAAKKSENWGEAAKARLDALNAARSIEAEAMAVLGKAKS